MPDYYNAPGAAAGDAMQQFMLQQQGLKHQALLDHIAQQREARLSQSDELELAMKRDELKSRQEDRVSSRAEKSLEADQKRHEKLVADHMKKRDQLVPGDFVPPELDKEAAALGIPLGKTVSSTANIASGSAAPQLPGRVENPLGSGAEVGSPQAPAALPGAQPPIALRIASMYAGNPAQRQALDTKKQQEAYIAQLPDGPLKDAATFRLRTGSAEPAGVLKAEAPVANKPIYGLGKTGKVEQIGEMPANAVLRNEPTMPDHSGADATRNATEANRVQQAREHGYAEHKESFKTINDQIMALDHLDDALAQHSGAADGLIVPLLLKGTIAGNGVRITQSEIDGVLKARNAYDSMKLNLNHWFNVSPDANGNRPPLVLTEEQRAAISDLSKKLRTKAEAAHAKMLESRKAIDDATDVASVNRARTGFELNRYSDSAPSTKPTAADLIKKYGHP